MDGWGDFNMILHMRERTGASTSLREIEEFRDMINKLDLVDLPLEGGKWTRSNSREIPSRSRIDCFLISNSLLLQLAGLR